MSSTTARTRVSSRNALNSGAYVRERTLPPMAPYISTTATWGLLNGGRFIAGCYLRAGCHGASSAPAPLQSTTLPTTLRRPAPPGGYHPSAPDRGLGGYAPAVPYRLRFGHHAGGDGRTVSRPVLRGCDHVYRRRPACPDHHHHHSGPDLPLDRTGYKEPKRRRATRAARWDRPRCAPAAGCGATTARAARGAVGRCTPPWAGS